MPKVRSDQSHISWACKKNPKNYSVVSPVSRMWGCNSTHDLCRVGQQQQHSLLHVGNRQQHPGQPEQHQRHHGKPEQSQQRHGKPQQSQRRHGKPEQSQRRHGQPEQRQQCHGQPEQHQWCHGQLEQRQQRHGQPEQRQWHHGQCLMVLENLLCLGFWILYCLFLGLVSDLNLLLPCSLIICLSYPVLWTSEKELAADHQHVFRG